MIASGLAIFNIKFLAVSRNASSFKRIRPVQVSQTSLFTHIVKVTVATTVVGRFVSPLKGFKHFLIKM